MVESAADYRSPLHSAPRVLPPKPDTLRPRPKTCGFSVAIAVIVRKMSVWTLETLWSAAAGGGPDEVEGTGSGGGGAVDPGGPSGASEGGLAAGPGPLAVSRLGLGSAFASGLVL